MPSRSFNSWAILHIYIWFFFPDFFPAIERIFHHISPSRLSRSFACPSAAIMWRFHKLSTTFHPNPLDPRTCVCVCASLRKYFSQSSSTLMKKHRRHSLPQTIPPRNPAPEAPFEHHQQCSISSFEGDSQECHIQSLLASAACSRRIYLKRWIN